MGITEVRRGVGTLAGTAIRSAASAVRHPIGSAARVVGFGKGTVVEAVHAARGLVTSEPHSPDSLRPAAEADRSTSPPPVGVPDPREPVVIEGEASPAPALHHEPKVASRDAAHGHGSDDPEQRSGFVEDLLEDEAESTPAEEVASDEPLLDPGAARAVRTEADMLGRAADPRPE